MLELKYRLYIWLMESHKTSVDGDRYSGEMKVIEEDRQMIVKALCRDEIQLKCSETILSGWTLSIQCLTIEEYIIDNL